MGDVKVVESPGDVVETRVLWLVQWRQDDTYPWNPIGLDRADLPEALRTYDYWVENHPDVEVRMVNTIVEIRVADPEKLREQLAKEAADRAAAALQSE